MGTRLSQLFAYPARTEVAGTLFFQPGELGLRQIALITGLQVRSVELALKDLQRDRLVRRRKSVNRVFFALNRSHPDYPLLACVFDAAASHRIREFSARLGQRPKELLRFVVTANRMVDHARRSRRGA
jgi:hypothetical protein